VRERQVERVDELDEVGVLRREGVVLPAASLLVVAEAEPAQVRLDALALALVLAVDLDAVAHVGPEQLARALVGERRRVAPVGKHLVDEAHADVVGEVRDVLEEEARRTLCGRGTGAGEVGREDAACDGEERVDGGEGWGGGGAGRDDEGLGELAALDEVSRAEWGAAPRVVGRERGARGGEVVRGRGG